MNKQDLEAFDKYLENRIFSDWDSSLEYTWQAALEYERERSNNIMDAMTQTTQHNAKLRDMLEKERERSKGLIEALANCPIVGEIHRDSSERFKEWNLIHRNAIKEALAKYRGEV